MANERDLPAFGGGIERVPESIGNANGLPVASKKQAGSLLKRIMAHAKFAKNPKLKIAPKKSTIGKSGRRGIEANSKIRIKPTTRYW